MYIFIDLLKTLDLVNGDLRTTLHIFQLHGINGPNIDNAISSLLTETFSCHV